MRLFVAVEVGEAVRAAAEHVARQLQRRLDSGVRVRWVPPENQHLTVRFIGHVHDDRVSSTLDTLRQAIAVKPFDLALSDGGVFPSSGPPRAIWVGLREGGPSLQAIHDELDRRLRPLGVEPETRPFTAHLTLGRIKDAPRGSTAAVREVVGAIRVAPARCRIAEAVVFESRLSPKGSTYLPRVHIPLRS